jgi:hypothetical protein
LLFYAFGFSAFLACALSPPRSKGRSTRGRPPMRSGWARVSCPPWTRLAGRDRARAAGRRKKRGKFLSQDDERDARRENKNERSRAGGGGGSTRLVMRLFVVGKRIGVWKSACKAVRSRTWSSPARRRQRGAPLFHRPRRRSLSFRFFLFPILVLRRSPSHRGRGAGWWCCCCCF